MVAVGAIRLLELCNERMPAGGEQLEVDVQLRGHLVPAINHLREEVLILIPIWRCSATCLILNGESVALDDFLKEAFLLAGVDHQGVVALLREMC